VELLSDDVRFGDERGLGVWVGFTSFTALLEAAGSWFYGAAFARGAFGSAGWGAVSVLAALGTAPAAESSGWGVFSRRL